MWGVVCVVASVQLAMAYGPESEQYPEGLLDVIVDMVTAPLSGLGGFQDPCVPAQWYSMDCYVMCVPKRVVQQEPGCYPRVPRRPPRTVTLRTKKTLIEYRPNRPSVRTLRPRIEKRASSRQYVQCPECPSCPRCRRCPECPQYRECPKCPRCPSPREKAEAPGGPVLEGIVVEAKKQKQPSPPAVKPRSPSPPASPPAKPTPAKTSEKRKKKLKSRKCPQCGPSIWIPYVPRYGGCHR